MWLNIDSLEKEIIINGLLALEKWSTDSIEMGKIYELRQKVEAIKPTSRAIRHPTRIFLMDEEGRFWVDGQEINPSELGFHVE